MSSSSAIRGSSTVEARQISRARDQNVGRPDCCDNATNRILHLLALADIGHRRRTSHPSLTKLVRESLQPRRVTIDQADARSAPRKQPAQLEPDAARGSAYDNNLLGGPHIALSLFPSPVAFCSYHMIGNQS